jgi:hypothetical protein
MRKPEQEVFLRYVQVLETENFKDSINQDLYQMKLNTKQKYKALETLLIDL